MLHEINPVLKYHIDLLKKTKTNFIYFDLLAKKVIPLLRYLLKSKIVHWEKQIKEYFDELERLGGIQPQGDYFDLEYFNSMMKDRRRSNKINQLWVIWHCFNILDSYWNQLLNHKPTEQPFVPQLDYNDLKNEITAIKTNNQVFKINNTRILEGGIIQNESIINLNTISNVVFFRRERFDIFLNQFLSLKSLTTNQDICFPIEIEIRHEMLSRNESIKDFGLFLLVRWQENLIERLLLHSFIDDSYSEQFIKESVNSIPQTWITINRDKTPKSNAITMLQRAGIKGILDEIFVISKNKNGVKMNKTIQPLNNLSQEKLKTLRRFIQSLASIEFLSK